MKNKIINLVCMILILAFFITNVNAGIPNHKPVICFSCHGVVGVGAEEEDECGTCHNYVENNRVNQSLIESQHNPNTCRICHGVKDKGTYHQTHINVTCSICHESGNAKPDSAITDCGGCHGGKMHDIHQGKINSICSNCHKSRPASDPASESPLSTNEMTAGIYARAVNYKHFTLYEIFQRILSSFRI